MQSSPPPAAAELPEYDRLYDEPTEENTHIERNMKELVESAEKYRYLYYGLLEETGLRPTEDQSLLLGQLSEASDAWLSSFGSVQDALNSDEMKASRERGIKLVSWLGLLKVAQIEGWKQERIDRMFTFTEGRIIAHGLSLKNHASVIHLPEELEHDSTARWPTVPPEGLALPDNDNEVE